MSTQSSQSAESRSIANMEGLQSAIANNEVDRVKQLLAGQTLDELQKSYLIDIAELNGDPKMLKILKDAPAKP
ncbi:hypothetical protein [Alteromonas confluentis]|uniref:Uncharacterized protein n=1 Tax=Alteromonas confluentis TaxID=1656094 RepID=A0A1E7Z6T9_9ALTE|nr:hypothetical protein [Alteromonas confluentis]OFC69141.1 hypothetical protein BFC18_20650 [Alteromonas confluentis]